MTNIGGSDNAAAFWDRTVKRIARLENSLGVIGAKIGRTIDARQQVFVGPNDPSVNLAPGTEYVWFHTDGQGNLQDTIVGMA